MRFGVPFGCCTALLGAMEMMAATPALALEHEPVPAAPAERRSGFVLGLSSGLAVAAASGYPNDVTMIDVPDFEASTGAAVSLGSALWLGGALADWLTIGVGLAGGSFEGNGLQATGGAFHVRIEAFPLFFRGGAFEDLGVSFSAGTGSYDVKRGDETVAEGEGTSAIGVGVFFEPWRFWRFSTGPDVSYAHQFSRSLSAHTLVVGWRLAFYAGP